MPDSNLDQIVDEYINRLKVASADLPPERKQQLIMSITDHISEARSTLQANSEIAVRDILDRVGQPEDIAAEALSDQAKPPVLHSTRNRGPFIIGVAVVVVLGIVLATFLVTRINNATPGSVFSVTTSTATVDSLVVPNVAGLTMSAAGEKLATLGFSYIAVSSCPAGKLRPGLVKSQSPIGGSSAARGSQVNLEIIPLHCP
jgi:uncharacterized membrane protein